MQAMIVTVIVTVDPCCALHVQMDFYFPCFMQKLLLHDRTDWSYKLHKLGGIVTFE